MSGDGRKLAFAAVSVDSQIWLQPVRKEGSPTAPATPLTSDTSRRNSVPVISPDGSKVAYVSTRRGEEPNVWVMGIDGRSPIQITSDETADHKPTWFPDGRRLAYLSRNGNTRGLWSVDVTTRRAQLLFEFTDQLARSFGGRFAELQLSPSITQLAFSVIEPPGGRRTIYVTPLNQYAPRALRGTEASLGYPAWSPDEKQLAVELKDGSTHVALGLRIGLVSLDFGLMTVLSFFLISLETVRDQPVPTLPM